MQKLDLTGQTFGKWLVLSQGETHKKRLYWLCRCKCGTEYEVDGYMLRRGESTQCRKCGYEPVPGRYGGRLGYRVPREDLTGKKFRMLTVLGQAPHMGKFPAWYVRCDCNREKVIREFSLLSGKIKSCGCESTIYRPIKQLEGQRFGHLVALRPGPNIPYASGSHRAWICQCDCGTEKNIREFFLLSGSYKSCGCRQYEGLDVRFVTHDMSHTREYRTWLGMRKRCNDPGHRSYPNYGGRGIRVFEEWNNSFEAFFRDVGPQPKHHYVLDRINNDGNYEAGNVRWVSPMQSMRNRRNTSMITAVDLVSLSSKVIRYHLKRGKTIEEIMERFEISPTKVVS